jgi:hypothetical protein
MSVVIQSGFSGIVEPIDQPRIGFDAHSAAGSATSSASGYSASWVTDGETWSVWRAGSSSSTLTLTFSNQTVSYAGLAAHNLGSIGATVSCQIGGTTVGSISPTDDSAIMFLFSPRTATTVQFVITGGVAEIAVAQAGEVLEMPRLSVYTGLPISESKQVRYRHQQSIRGDVLGRAVEGAELAFDLTINNLPETFRATAGDVTWQGLLRHIDSTGPFFIAAKPGSYPEEVAYVQAVERPRFERQTPNHLLSGSVTFSCRGYAAP